MMRTSKHYFLFVVILFIFCAFVSCNKYDKPSNDYYKKDYQREQYKRDKDSYKQAQKDYLNDDYQRKAASDPNQFDDFDIRKVNKPFRMAKLNLLWTKAVSRLTEPKLKSLFSELKVHDKEEMQWKRLAAEGSDKDGLLEAELRRKLTSIMNVYGLLEHFEDVPDPRQFKPHNSYPGRVDDHLNRHLFRDKKLNKLWEKAERSGFTPEELRMLKEEFDHHQEKVDQYYSILNTVEADSIDEKLDRFNELDQLEESDPVSRDYLAKVIQLRDSHKTIRDDYDRLYRLAMSGPDSQEFIEPKVQGLWKLAMTANFKPDELESIKSELQHYEKRLLKLRRMHLDAAMGQEKRKIGGGYDYNQNVNIHYPGSFSEDEIKHQTRKVAKIHLDLESKIMERHSEL
uniref:Alpha-2-macroglobulin receptor-associated protein n=1 Tax=Lygus hesperus TaxID=30085 RepID=A0A0A9WRM6_LYGHE